MLEKHLDIADIVRDGRKTGYRDNWLFITPGLDLREDMSTTWRLFGQVKLLFLGECIGPMQIGVSLKYSALIRINFSNWTKRVIDEAE